MTELTWPALPSGQVPAWTGTHFEVNGQAVPFLSYSENLAGWDDGLTSLHRREAAGQHPIDLTSRFNAVESLKTALARTPKHLLEVGSSDGFLLKDLKKAFPRAMVVGSEVAAGALAQMAKDLPGTPLLQLDILNCTLPDASFDAIVALNVLEHIDDDKGAVKQMARLLNPGGVVVLEVPAGPLLFDAYDAQLHHFRRYRLPELMLLVRDAGLKTIHQGHLGFFVFPAFAAAKLLNKLRSKSLEGSDVVGKSIRQSRYNPLVAGVFALERALLGSTSLPFGIRCVVVASKP